MVDVEAVRTFALDLPRTTEHFVRGRRKFRVGRLVYAGLSKDERLMGFAFPKIERDDLIASEPGKFLMPPAADLRYNWVVGRLALIDDDEMRELVLDAWTMCVPKFLNREYRLANDWPLDDQ